MKILLPLLVFFGSLIACKSGHTDSPDKMHVIRTPQLDSIYLESTQGMSASISKNAKVYDMESIYHGQLLTFSNSRWFTCPGVFVHIQPFNAKKDRITVYTIAATVVLVESHYATHETNPCETPQESWDSYDGTKRVFHLRTLPDCGSVGD